LANNVLFVHITNDLADRTAVTADVGVGLDPLVDAILALHHGPGLTSGVPILAVALAPYWDEAWIGK
jgi:hypothetical protein